MFNYSGCGDFVLDRLINEANEKLKSNKLKIMSEKIKIKHAENLLNHFNKRLEEQNEDLKMFVEKEDRLEEEISTCTGLTFSREVRRDKSLAGSHKEVNSEKPCLKRKNSEEIDDVNKEVSYERNNVMRKNPEDNVSEIIEMFPSKSSGAAEEHKSEQSNAELSLKLMDVPILKGVTVRSICTFDNGFLFGGSKGFFVNYENKTEHIYETEVEDDIIKIEIMKEAKKTFVIAFTKKDIIIYKHYKNKKPLKKLVLKEMASVFNEGNLLYFILNNGRIRIMNKIFWKIYDYKTNNYAKLGVLFPSTISTKYSLLNVKHKFLYKTRNKDFTGLQCVKGVENVTSVTSAKGLGILCSSPDVIYFLNKEYELSGSLKLQNKIKFIESNVYYCVFTDCLNILYVYTLLPNSSFGEKVFEKQMEGEITAITFKDTTVYVAVGDVIYSLTLKS